jgi:hypothetical protein
MTTTDNAIDRLFEKATIISLAPDQEQELRSVAAHEAGHAVTASRLGIENACLVAGPAAGICALASISDPLKRAAVSWGGVVAESLLALPFRGRKLPPFKLTEWTVFDWSRQVQLHTLSTEDREGIEACDLHSGCKLAFDTLSQNMEILEYAASSLASRSRKLFAENASRGKPSLDRELDAFSVLFHAGQRARTAERKTDKALADTDAATEALTPCQVPSAFNFSTFLANTGSTEAEADDFVRDRTRRDGWGVGRVATEKDFEVAIEFFRERLVTSRQMWITMAKEFHSWRQQQTQTERSKNEH